MIIFSSIGGPGTGAQGGEDAAKEVQYDAKGKRDPFVPLMGVKPGLVSGLFGVESVDDIRLEGLVFDPVSGSVAIANGVVLREKEIQEQVEVIEIREDGVMFRIKGEPAFKPWGGGE